MPRTLPAPRRPAGGAGGGDGPGPRWLPGAVAGSPVAAGCGGGVPGGCRVRWRGPRWLPGAVAGSPVAAGCGGGVPGGCRVRWPGPRWLPGEAGTGRGGVRGLAAGARPRRARAGRGGQGQPRRSSRTMSTMMTMTTMVPIPIYTGVAPLNQYCMPGQVAGPRLGYPGEGAQNVAVPPGTGAGALGPRGTVVPCHPSDPPSPPHRSRRSLRSRLPHRLLAGCGQFPLLSGPAPALVRTLWL